MLITKQITNACSYVWDQFRDPAEDNITHEYQIVLDETHDECIIHAHSLEEAVVEAQRLEGTIVQR